MSRRRDLRRAEDIIARAEDIIARYRPAPTIEERLAGACLAMSRFLTWVQLEASARRYASDHFSLASAREVVFRVALERGLFRLEWPG